MISTVGGGVESMSRVGIGASGGAWPVDPAIAIKSYFMPQGVSADLIATKYGFSRDDVDQYAVTSQQRAAKAWSEGRFKNSIAPVRDINGITLLDRDEHMRPTTDMQSLAALKPSFTMMGEQGGFDAVAVDAHPEVESDRACPSCRQFVGHCRWRRCGPDRLGRGRAAMGRKPRAKIRAFANIGSEPAMMLTGPGRCHQEGAGARRHEARGHRSLRGQRSVCLRCPALRPGLRP